MSPNASSVIFHNKTMSTMFLTLLLLCASASAIAIESHFKGEMIKSQLIKNATKNVDCLSNIKMTSHHKMKLNHNSTLHIFNIAIDHRNATQENLNENRCKNIVNCDNMLSFPKHVSDHRKNSIVDGSLIPLPFMADKSLVNDVKHHHADTLESSFVGENPQQLKHKHIHQCHIAIIECILLIGENTQQLKHKHIHQ